MAMERGAATARLWIGDRGCPFRCGGREGDCIVLGPHRCDRCLLDSMLMRGLLADSGHTVATLRGLRCIGGAACESMYLCASDRMSPTGVSDNQNVIVTTTIIIIIIIVLSHLRRPRLLAYQPSSSC